MHAIINIALRLRIANAATHDSETLCTGEPVVA
jgi:hypothetical protein